MRWENIIEPESVYSNFLLNSIRPQTLKTLAYIAEYKKVSTSASTSFMINSWSMKIDIVYWFNSIQHLRVVLGFCHAENLKNSQKARLGCLQHSVQIKIWDSHQLLYLISERPQTRKFIISLLFMINSDGEFKVFVLHQPVVQHFHNLSRSSDSRKALSLLFRLYFSL